MNVWSHFKKKSQKGTKHLPPFCAIQQLEFLSCGLSLVPYLFKEECTRVGTAARKTWALGTPHGTEAPGEPLLSSSPLFPALAAGLGALEQDVLLGLPPAASSPASDNRAATGEEHRMLSVSFLWVPWKGFGARGGDGGRNAVEEQRRNWAGEVAVSFLSDSGGPWRHLFSTPCRVAIGTN